IEKGAILIRDGKIADLGATVTAPAGARPAKLIDGTGLSAYPGMIDTNTIIGLTEVGQGAPGTVDTTELGDYNANMKALTAVNPHTEHIPVARSNGVTSVLTCPRGGVISGQCALINLDGWNPHEMKVRAPAAMLLNYPVIGFGGRGGGFGGGRFGGGASDAMRQLRDRRVDELKRKLDDAQAYLKAKQAAAADKSLPARTTDLGLEALIPVIRGEVPVAVAADKEADIKAAIELAGKYNLKMILVGGDEAYKVAAQLREKNIAVILPSVLALPGGEDAPYDEAFSRAAILHKAGVKFAFSSDGDSAYVRLLPYHAGVASAFGLPKEEALKAVTIYPAQILGVDSQIGSLEKGKMANLIITDGDPLEFKTRVKHMFIAGRLVDMSNKHTKLYDKFRDRP
ncbi:MAG: amidohydrolase family protein, partial [Blastocatellia bacterium]